METDTRNSLIHNLVLPTILCALVLPAFAAEGDATAPALYKSGGVFYPPVYIERARANADKFEWAAAMRDNLVARAQPWLELSDDQLWDAMFGPAIPRSWMVWSDGYCPACKEDVRMYDWETDPFAYPWKVQCPHCAEFFPKNDFDAFRRSGLNERGFFDPALADRSLLFNTEHPDPADPLHLFGVDDGTGFVADEHTWRFIGAYVIYGQWKKFVVLGCTNLGAAYIVTGDPRYAHKAAILLDRVADIYPEFNFEQQAVVYERKLGSQGYVSIWHDACEEVRELALAYDRIFSGAKQSSEELVAFLDAKARAHPGTQPKNSWEAVQRNIESGIFRDTLANAHKIQSNYPRTPMAILTIKIALEWPGNRDEVFALLDDVIKQATAVDGVSGEKGLANYSTIAPRALADMLARFRPLEEDILATLVERHPVLRDAWRFHIDTWVMESYYPLSGDTGVIAQKIPNYAGADFTTNPGVEPSIFTFFWDLYEATNDPASVQVLYGANKDAVEGLPYDLFAEDPAGFQDAVAKVIAETGSEIAPPSVNKSQWHLAVLRSGAGENQRALWLDYDSSGGHRHSDGMNLGLFAYGLDLVPDFGYPPVGYSGWDSPKSRWYQQTAAHVTVTVDGANQAAADGVSTRWIDQDRVHLIRAEGPAMIQGEAYTRTIALIDVSPESFYVVDVFRVRGGQDHSRFFHSAFGTIQSAGLELAPAEPLPLGEEMRKYQSDPAPEAGWSVDWTIEDKYGYREGLPPVHLRHTDFTRGAAAYTAEGWVDTHLFGGSPAWIPRIITRRTTDEGVLDSTFVSIIEPYIGEPVLTAQRRLELVDEMGNALGDSVVGLELERRDGLTDLLLVADKPAAMKIGDRDIVFNGEFAVITMAGGTPVDASFVNAHAIQIGDTPLSYEAPLEYIKLNFDEKGSKE